jgi:hypothetical protein
MLIIHIPEPVGYTQRRKNVKRYLKKQKINPGNADWPRKRGVFRDYSCRGLPVTSVSFSFFDRPKIISTTPELILF